MIAVMEIFKDRRLIEKTPFINYERVNEEDCYDGFEVKEDIFKDKLILLLFACSWSVPCQEFLPTLKKTFDECQTHSATKDKLFVIYVPYEESELLMRSFMAKYHGDWFAVPFGDYKSE